MSVWDTEGGTVSLYYFVKCNFATLLCKENTGRAGRSEVRVRGTCLPSLALFPCPLVCLYLPSSSYHITCTRMLSSFTSCLNRWRSAPL